MREAILYQLIQNYRSCDHVYIPVFAFQGDVWSEELKLGGFVSHECSARLSEMNKTNHGLLDIKKRKAKYSPTRYYCYRITPKFTEDLLRDDDLKAFYKLLGHALKPSAEKPKRECRYDAATNCMIEIIYGNHEV